MYDYVTCFLTIIRRIYPTPLEGEKSISSIETSNRSAQMARRKECANVKAVLYSAVKVELIMAENYKSPAPDEN